MGYNENKKNDVKGPLDTIMKGLEGVFGLVDDLIINSENFKQISGEFNSPTQNKVKAQYGVSVKMGLDKNYSTINRNPLIKTEPSVDIYEEANEYKIIILTRNIEENDIKISIKNNCIIFEAQNVEIIYYKEIALPCVIDDQKLAWSYKNGVTEVSVGKQP